MENRMKTLLFIAKGRVQGVGFRYFTQKGAVEIGIFGTVKNLTDGSVEIICQGIEGKIGLFRNYLKKGPLYGQLDELLESSISSSSKYSSFDIIG